VTDAETARGIVVVEPTCSTLPKSVRLLTPWCVRVFRFEVSRQIKRERAERLATRLRNQLSAALAEARREGAMAGIEACLEIVSARPQRQWKHQRGCECGFCYRIAKIRALDAESVAKESR